MNFLFTNFIACFRSLPFAIHLTIWTFDFNYYQSISFIPFKISLIIDCDNKLVLVVGIVDFEFYESVGWGLVYLVYLLATVGGGAICWRPRIANESHFEDEKGIEVVYLQDYKQPAAANAQDMQNVILFFPFPITYSSGRGGIQWWPGSPLFLCLSLHSIPCQRW